MENIEYFSFRINLSTGAHPIYVDDILELCAPYKCCLVVKECADKKVKNDHVHGIIWNEAVDKDEFTKRMKALIPNVCGYNNGRYAICETELNGQNFYKACCYLCKGLREAKPLVIINTSFTEPQIEEFWLDFWAVKSTLIKKHQEDTSQRMIPKLFELHGQRVKQNCHNRYQVFMEWRSICLAEWKKELKPYDTDSFMRVVMGLMLQTDEVDFDIYTLDKHLKIAGFSNSSVEYYKRLDEEG